MPLIFQKVDIPNAQYTPIKYHDDTVMMTITPNGPVLVYVESNEKLFVPWEEIVEFAATSPNKKNMDIDEPAEDTKKRGGPREIKPPK
jgi:hypothetical protein